MDGGAWKAAVHGVAEGWTQLSDSLSLFTFMHWRRKWQATPVFLPGEFHGQKSLAGYSLQGSKETDVTERLNTAIWTGQEHVPVANTHSSSGGLYNSHWAKSSGIVILSQSKIHWSVTLMTIVWVLHTNISIKMVTLKKVLRLPTDLRDLPSNYKVLCKVEQNGPWPSLLLFFKYCPYDH